MRDHPEQSGRSCGAHATDAPPPADTALLALANRALMEQLNIAQAEIERLQEHLSWSEEARGLVLLERDQHLLEIERLRGALEGMEAELRRSLSTLFGLDVTYEHDIPEATADIYSDALRDINRVIICMERLKDAAPAAPSAEPEPPRQHGAREQVSCSECGHWCDVGCWLDLHPGSAQCLALRSPMPPAPEPQGPGEGE